MPVYVAERKLRGLTVEVLDTAQKSLIETSARFIDNGKPVRYIRTLYMPGESRCMCLFEAANLQIVKEVTDTAGISYDRVQEAVDLTPDASAGTAALSTQRDGVINHEETY